MDPASSVAEPPGATPGDPPRGIEAGLSREQRRIARRCLLVLGLLGGGSMVGVASSLYLVSHYPLLLIALSPIGRHLILVAPIVNPYAFIAVAVGRRTAFYLACFYLGRALGAAAIDWLEARWPRSARFVRWLERLFERWSYAAVFLLPGPAMSTIAGDSTIHVGVFLALLTAGLVLRMLIVIWIGDWLREPIEVLLAWIREYWLPGTIVLIAGIALYQRRKRRPAPAINGSEHSS
jgi:membrane protein DedA with SNARE-associated domain